MNIPLFVKKNLLLITLILVSLLLRFYKLADYMVFLGDEGRDAIVAKKILTEKHFVLLGPPMSVGNLYLGPLYYYMIAFSMSVFWLNPIAAAGMNALIGVLTVVLIFLLAREWFNSFGAFCGAFLYAISPINIIYSRSSWNPNPTPFFSLLAIWSIYLCLKKKDGRFLCLTGVFTAFALQMHYWAILLLFLVTVIWFQTLAKILKGSLSISKFYTGTSLGISSFLVLMSPLLIFDLRHNFMNYRAFVEFFLHRDSTFSLNLLNVLNKAWDIYINKLVGRFMAGENPIITITLSMAILGFLIYNLVKRRSWENKTLLLWITIGVTGLTLYRGQVYDHYLGSINPAPYLCISAILASLKKSVLWVGILIVIMLALLNFKNNPLFSPPGKQLERTQKIAKFIIEKSENKPFNFALIAERNYDSAYQYYLDVYDHKPKQLPFEITPQLWVVCEDKVCNPIGHPKYEIAAFGWSKKDLEFEVDDVKIYKLAHFK